VRAQPASQQGQAGGALTYTVSVTNKDTACATATFAAAAALPSGWTATFTPPSLSLASGASGAISMKVTSSMDATGSNVIPATVSNTADGTLKASAPATYVVQAPSGTPGSFSDNFDRPDAAALGNGWTPVSGSLSIKGNQAATSTARSTHMAVQSSISGATQSASARFAWGNNQVPARFAVVARYKDAKNYLLCYRQASPGSVGVSRVVNGVETILKSTSVVNPVQGQFFALGCQAEGASVTVTLNGQNRATATNAAVVSGKTGIAVTYPAGNRRTAGAVHRIDDFAATAQ